MIRVGRIVNILGDAENGLYGAKYVSVLLNNSPHIIKGYAKQLSDTEIMVEIISALMGRELNLPIPEPVLGIYGTDSLWFISIDVKVPDLSHRMTIDVNQQMANDQTNLKILEKLCQWSDICLAIGFDEWIANDDRNLGNILYDGNDQFYLIDHNRAMRLPFFPEAPINNQLLNIKLHCTQDEVGKQRIKNHIEAFIHNTNKTLPIELISKIKEKLADFDDEILDNIAEFLQKRLNYVSKITADKITTQQQSL